MATPVDSQESLRAMLRTYKLESLTDEVFGLLGKGTITTQTDADEIGFLLRDTDVYKTRFAGNVALEKAGKSPYSISNYLQLEEGYKAAMQGSGLPSSFYDGEEDYAGFIGGDVSVAEVKSRVDEGFKAVKDANPETIKAMKDLYGVGENDLAAYFLDPVKATPLLTRQASAAKVASEAQRQASIGLTVQQAEGLAAEDIRPATLQQGFAEIGASQGLYSDLIGENNAVTTDEQIGATFGTNKAAAQRVAQRKRQRAAEFDVGGSFAADKSGVIGLGNTK